MNVAIKGLAPAVSLVTDRLERADKALDAYIEAAGELYAVGGEAARISGIPSSLLSPAAQRAALDAIVAATAAQSAHTAVHRALHQDAERLNALQPGGDPTPQVSGGKVPPPPP